MIKTPLSTMIGGAFWTPGCTIIGGASKTLNQLIKSLFANNEQGFACDPNDLTTLYQDAAGTIPVTAAGQPVGLVLDKSKGLVLGGELVVNGDFSNGTTGWSSVDGFGTPTNVNMSVSGGVMTCSGVNGVRLLQSQNLTVGKWYVLECDVISTDVAIALYAALNIDLTGAIAFESQRANTGKRRIYFSATQTLIYVGIRCNVAGTFSVDNITVKELLGNHAYQKTSAMRPLLVANPQRLDYDTVDDKMTTNLPTELTGCTVIRSVPNVGTHILTGQTIPTIYNDNIDNCGLIVINRALTASETSQITKLFNKAAGV